MNLSKTHFPVKLYTFLDVKKPTSDPEEARKKAMYQIIAKEQQYVTGLQFAITRFVSALAERKDLITPTEHRTLFQNVEEVNERVLIIICSWLIDLFLEDFTRHRGHYRRGDPRRWGTTN